MKLFQRIFATFCAVFICAIFVASFSFWLVQNTHAENHRNQQRMIEEMLLESVVSSFRLRGEAGAREVLLNWHGQPHNNPIIVIAGDGKQDILGRVISAKRIEQAKSYTLQNPNDESIRIEFDRLGEEYLFFIRDWDKKEAKRLSSPLYIPGLPLEPIWHELIILSFIFAVGLLLAYILANNITKPIRILGQGMSNLAAGDFETRISPQMTDRQDELSHLAGQFDKMAQQLKKLVEKERHLLHHVSHEMRSPLARIQAIIGLIHAQPHKQEQYLQRLENELERMDTLVGELLTLSRLESSNQPVEKEPLKLFPFLQQLVEDSQSVAQHNQQKVEFCGQEKCKQAVIMANESYLYRAIDNVIRNAMKYSPEGAKITIYFFEDPDHWVIDVIDNGKGVDEHQLPHIFTAFYRADSSANKVGTGLGLAITRHVMEQHGGHVFAENIQPNGLKVRFVFPKIVKPTSKKREN